MSSDKRFLRFEPVAPLYDDWRIMECPICFALVSEVRTDEHEAWHDRLADHGVVPPPPAPGCRHVSVLGTSVDGDLYRWTCDNCGTWALASRRESPIFPYVPEEGARA